MKHCIIDFETMGIDVNNCVVIDMSALVFDWDKFSSNNPYNFKDISQVQKYKFDIREQVSKYNFTIDKSTVKFWEDQPPEVRKNIVPRNTDISLEQFAEQFISYLIPHGKISYWWSRSNSFDPCILWRLFDVIGKKQQVLEYLPHWSLRDTRTWIDAKLDFPRKNGFCPIEDEKIWEQTFKAHDSSWDILADVLRLQAIDRAEKLD
jgi:hypothetical protein